jgi:uncharacterized membrane protein
MNNEELGLIAWGSSLLISSFLFFMTFILAAPLINSLIGMGGNTMAFIITLDICVVTTLNAHYRLPLIAEGNYE